eukprot:365282-Chlamydomonas_euryale.AAC.9
MDPSPTAWILAPEYAASPVACGPAPLHAAQSHSMEPHRVRPSPTAWIPTPAYAASPVACGPAPLHAAQPVTWDLAQAQHAGSKRAGCGVATRRLSQDSKAAFKPKAL